MKGKGLSLASRLLAWAIGCMAGALITLMNTGISEIEGMGKQQRG